MTSDLRLFAGAILRSDFYSFVQAIFPIVSPNAAFAPNWHIEAIAYALTRVLKGEIKRLIITLPPRGLKSICASVAFPAFVLGHDPTKRIICVSYSETLACKHANDCRAVMRSPFYRRLFSDTRISSTKNCAEMLGVDLIASHRNEIKAALSPDHQAILDGYFARQSGVTAPSTSSPVFAPPALLDDDTTGQG
jgi:hypothetical protein